MTRYGRGGYTEKVEKPIDNLSHLSRVWGYYILFSREEFLYMRIEGFDVTYLSSYDGLPVKNHLPVELRERFKTENQWLESGYVLVAGAVGLEMHPTAVSRTLCTYYLDTQVEER